MNRTTFRPELRIGVRLRFLAGPVLLLAVLTVWAPPYPLPPGVQPYPDLGAATAQCGAPSRTPSALSISLTPPTSTVRAGGSVGLTYSVAVANSTAGHWPVAVYVPSVTANFPVKSGGSWLLFEPSQTVSLSGAGWASSASVTRVKPVASDLTFSPSRMSRLSTQKIAVMAPADYGQLTLEFRWHWSVQTGAGSGTTNGSWSVPNRTATAPDLPSEFFPAPFVGLAKTTGTSVPPGTNYTAELNGAVDNTSFRVVVEYPNNGTEITSRWETTPLGASFFNASAPMSYAGGAPLPGGKYLVHVHDHCQAILHSISVTVT
jgi:hypothetical protein